MRTFFRNKNYVEIETPSKIPVVRAMEQPDLMNGVIDRGKYGMHDTRWPLPPIQARPTHIGLASYPPCVEAQSRERHV